MTFSTHNALQKQWIPVYGFAGVILVFVPYMEIVGYALCLLAGIVWFFERTRKQLERGLRLHVHTHESLLFVGDETEVQVMLDGSETVERLGLPVRVRMKSNTALSFPDHDRSPNS